MTVTVGSIKAQLSTPGPSAFHYRQLTILGRAQINNSKYATRININSDWFTGGDVAEIVGRNKQHASPS